MRTWGALGDLCGLLDQHGRRRRLHDERERLVCESGDHHGNRQTWLEALSLGVKRLTEFHDVQTTLAVLLASVLFSVFVASRLVRPLQVLSDWAVRLTQSDWNAQAPKSSPIRELRSLADSMGYMAGAHVGSHCRLGLFAPTTWLPPRTAPT
eukprot:gene15997-21706_t